MGGYGLETINQKLFECRDVIQAIRHYDLSDKSRLSEFSGLSWPTVNTQLGILEQQNIIKKIDREKEHDREPTYVLNEGLTHFIGIAIGSKQIKLLIVNFRFKCIEWDSLFCNNNSSEHNISEDTMNKYASLKENSNSDESSKECLCFNSPNDTVSLGRDVNQLLEFIKLLRQDGVPISGIGLSFTGAVDSANRIVIGSIGKSYIRDLSLEDLVANETLNFFKGHNIPICFEHNAKATAIAEKEYLYFDENKKPANTKNMAAIYFGTGIVAGLIMNNTLYRGASNFGGDIGHIAAPEFSGGKKKEVERCVCGADNCLQHRFEEYGLQECINGKSAIDENTSSAFEFYLGYIIEMLSSILNLELIIISGKLAQKEWGTWNIINLLKEKIVLPYIAKDIQIRKSNIKGPPAAIGAAINSYYTLVNSGNPKKQGSIDCDTTISWLDVQDNY